MEQEGNRSGCDLGALYWPGGGTLGSPTTDAYLQVCSGNDGMEWQRLCNGVCRHFPMNVRCHREGLLSAVQLGSVAVPSRDLKPILQNINVTGDTDRCTLLATDLALGTRLEVVGIEVEEAGEALLPSRRLLEMLHEAPDEEMVLMPIQMLARFAGSITSSRWGARRSSVNSRWVPFGQVSGPGFD